jgi:CRISPR system CASCADE complex protein CasE/Cse3
MDGSHYLTRMEINPRRRAARRYLGSPQVMHAAVEAAFPATSAGERRLWRIDRVGEGVWLYLTSGTRPDLTHIVEDIGRPRTQGWETKDYTPLLDKLAAGQVWAFRLTANPTHSGRRSRDSADTQRFGHLTVTQQEQWLGSRLVGWGTRCIGTPQGAGEEGGPAPLSFAAVGREVVQFSHGRSGTGGRQVTLTRTSYEGALEVVDPQALRSALVNGMGHAKAYGCGLMTLARP